MQDRGPFSLGPLPGGQSPPSSVCALSPEEEGRRRGGLGCDPEFLNAWVSTVNEPFHTLGPVFKSCLLRGPILGVSPAGTGHRLQGAGLVMGLAVFNETLKGSEQLLFPGSLIRDGC